MKIQVELVKVRIYYHTGSLEKLMVQWRLSEIIYYHTGSLETAKNQIAQVDNIYYHTGSLEKMKKVVKS